MTAPAGNLINQADLEARIGKRTLGVLLSDDRAGVADARVVKACIDYAEAQVHSFLARAFGSLTIPVDQAPKSELLKEAALLFARPWCFQRHPEYVRTYGEGKRADESDAIAYMERICSGVQVLSDVKEQQVPTPSVGVVYSSGPRLMIDGVDGTENGAGF